MANQRFFGLHFDFHADNETEIGVRTNPEDIQRYIDDARPTFIQCDCKGHPGNSSYPTKVGNAAKNLKADNLRIWCDVAKKNNLPIFVHYSGVIDRAYEQAHPEKSQTNEEGVSRNEGLLSLFSDYVDDLLIPQLKELIDEYDIDGVWVDGDCWAVCPDFSESIQPYLHDGISEEEHNRILHDAFLRYADHYVTEFHQYKQGFLITSNWMYTSYIPEKPIVPIDFISGDYRACDSVHCARYETRCIAKRGKPWDLMAWGFGLDQKNSDDLPQKSGIQLCQEAAVTLSLGGGFQVYETQNKDGSAKVYENGRRLRELSDFVHKRRMNFEKLPIAQTMVFFSTESYYKKSHIFNAAGATEPLIGTLNAVLDAQYTADVLMDYQIDNLTAYDIVLIPQWNFIGDEVRRKLLSYAECGGHLIAIGAELCVQMGNTLGKSFEICEKQYRSIKSTDGMFTRIHLPVADLKEGDELLYCNSDMRDADLPAYKTERLGQGSITYLPFDFGDCYFKAPEFLKRDFLKKIMRTLAEPVVQINYPDIDITMQEEEGGFLVNLINMNQSRRMIQTMTYEAVPPLPDVEVMIKTAAKTVTMPLGEKFESEISDDWVKVRIPKLEIHSIIKIIEK